MHACDLDCKLDCQMFDWTESEQTGIVPHPNLRLEGFCKRLLFSLSPAGNRMVQATCH